MKKMILIVDDENDCAELLSYSLRKENYQTEIARNGEEAIDAVQCRMPDAVLLDVMMPRLNGWEVCRILRESTKGRSLPIIMLSALADEEERIKGLSLGADDYVTKPYSMKELLLKLKKLMDKRESVARLKVRENEQDTTIKYMVHELRNSLAAIGGFSSLALRKDDSNRHLKTINTAATHAESLLNDASLLSRLETGGERLSVERVDVGRSVAEAAELFHYTAKKRNIELLVQDGKSPFVRGNETAIKQVLINLLSNAVKYNRNHGKVRVSISDEAGWVAVSIGDEGCGMTAEERVRVFDKFYRASGAEQIKGAGLGLYIVRLLMEDMNGRVDIDSRPGAGSTFTVTFMKEKED